MVYELLQHIDTILLYYRFERAAATKLFLIRFKWPNWPNCIYNDLPERSKIKYLLLGPALKMGRRISGTPEPSSEFKSEKHAVKRSATTRQTCPSVGGCNREQPRGRQFRKVEKKLRKS